MMKWDYRRNPKYYIGRWIKHRDLRYGQIIYARFDYDLDSIERAPAPTVARGAAARNLILTIDTQTYGKKNSKHSVISSKCTLLSDEEVLQVEKGLIHRKIMDLMLKQPFYQNHKTKRQTLPTWVELSKRRRYAKFISPN